MKFNRNLFMPLVRCRRWLCRRRCALRSAPSLAAGEREAASAAIYRSSAAMVWCKNS